MSSDIHANLTALEAVTIDLRTVSPDLVIHGGHLSEAALIRPKLSIWSLARVSGILAASSLQHWHAVVLRSASWTRAALGTSESTGCVFFRLA